MRSLFASFPFVARASRGVLAAGLVILGCAGKTASLDTADASAGVVRCGDHSCASAEACCGPSSIGPPPVCGVSCPNGVDVLRCDGPEDCGGHKCCSHFFQDEHSEATCTDDCRWGNGLQLCHTNDDCVNVSVPGATSCCPINARLYPGLGVCDTPTGEFCKSP